MKSLNGRTRLTIGACLSLLTVFLFAFSSLAIPSFTETGPSDFLASQVASDAKTTKAETLVYQITPKRFSVENSKVLNAYANQDILRFAKMRNHYDGLAIFGADVCATPSSSTMEEGFLAGISVSSSNDAPTGLYYITGTFIQTYFDDHVSSEAAKGIEFGLGGRVLYVSDLFAERYLGLDGNISTGSKEKYAPIIKKNVNVSTQTSKGVEETQYRIVNVYSTRNGFGHGERFAALYGPNLFFGYRYSHFDIFPQKHLDIQLGTSVFFNRQYLEKLYKDFPVEDYTHEICRAENGTFKTLENRTAEIITLRQPNTNYWVPVIGIVSACAALVCAFFVGRLLRYSRSWIPLIGICAIPVLLWMPIHFITNATWLTSIGIFPSAFLFGIFYLLFTLLFIASVLLQKGLTRGNYDR